MPAFSNYKISGNKTKTKTNKTQGKWHCRNYTKLDFWPPHAHVYIFTNVCSCVTHKTHIRMHTHTAFKDLDDGIDYYPSRHFSMNSTSQGPFSSSPSQPRLSPELSCSWFPGMACGQGKSVIFVFPVRKLRVMELTSDLCTTV